ncbi:MAG: hypothetical protein AAGD96_05175 [Chloroflexota bacterium]
MINLQTAWEAIEKGDSVEAQSIVAQILRDDPNNAEAWMVLGEAVSGDRKELFFRKALQLDPDLEIAKQRLEQLEVLETVEPEVNGSAMTVPPGVSLDAPTVPIEERLSEDRPSPQLKAHGQQGAASQSKPKPQPKRGNTALLIILFLLIILAIYFFIDSLPV